MYKWFFMLLLICIKTYAIQVKPVHDNDSVNALVSQDNKTRIFVKDERISDLHGTPGAYTFVNDNTRGEVFIMPTPDFKHKPFSLFITTEKGKTYGLTLTPKPLSTETIMLKPKDVNQTKAQAWEMASSYETAIVKLMQYMVNGMQPEGYFVTTIKHSKTYYLGNIATLRLQKVYQGAHLQGEIYLLKNRLKKTIRLTQSEFYRPGTRAIAIADQTVPAKATTIVYGVISHG